MKLRQPEPLGIKNHHDIGIRHIDPHLDHGRRYQDMRFPVPKSRHHSILFLAGDFSMQKIDLKMPQSLQPFGMLFKNRTRPDGLTLLDQRINQVGLTPFFQLSDEKPLQIVDFRPHTHSGYDRTPARRQLIKHRDLQIPVYR